MISSLRKVAAVLGVASLLVGCSRDISVDFQLISSPQGVSDVSLTFEQVRLEEGFAVAVLARPLDNSDKMDWETQLELVPVVNNVFDIESLEWDEDREESRDYDLRDGDWNFLIWGMSTGVSSIDVYVDGQLEAEIPVVVNEQQADL